MREVVVVKVVLEAEVGYDILVGIFEVVVFPSTFSRLLRRIDKILVHLWLLF